MPAMCAPAAETVRPKGRKRGRLGVERAQDDLSQIRRTLPNAHLHVEMSALPRRHPGHQPRSAFSGICRRMPRSAFLNRAIRLQ
jgi:hypothetical protein